MARQCLVIFTGTTFYGRITTQGLSYKVQQANSELVIPFTQVLVTANSVEEAYAKLRRGIQEPTTGQFLWLARWCCEQGMMEESSELCEAILKSEPTHAEALRIWKKSASPGEAERSLLRPATVGTDPVVLTAAGISSAANADFIRRIQPLLINSCAQRGCHSADSKQEFRLSAYRLHDGPRYRSHENLAEALKRVTPGNPEQSPLLLTTQASEHHKNVFDGPGGEECRRQLNAWILRVALEQNWIRQANPQVTGPPTPTSTSPSDVRLLSSGSKKGK